MKTLIAIAVLGVIALFALAGKHTPTSQTNSHAMSATERQQIWDNVDRTVGREPESDRIKREDERESRRVLGCAEALTRMRMVDSWTTAYSECKKHSNW
jgi:hypothetical protein